MNLAQEAALVAGKDLRIEARSRVTIRQIIPFGLITLVLFAFALDPDRGILRHVAPGLFWVTILLALLLAISRAYSIESDNGATDSLRMSGLDPSGIFLGKATAIAVELMLLEIVLTVGVVVLFNVSIASIGFLGFNRAGRDRRASRHRYSLRSVGLGASGTRNAGTGIAATSCGTDSSRGDTGMGGSNRRVGI